MLKLQGLLKLLGILSAPVLSEISARIDQICPWLKHGVGFFVILITDLLDFVLRFRHDEFIRARVFLFDENHVSCLQMVVLDLAFFQHIIDEIALAFDLGEIVGLNYILYALLISAMGPYSISLLNI